MARENKKRAARPTKKTASPAKVPAAKIRGRSRPASARRSAPRLKRVPNPEASTDSRLYFPGDVQPAHALPAAAASFQEVTGDLPSGYGDHFIYLMVRDPYWLYAYWEIQKQREEAALQKLGGSWNQVRTILRLYRLSGSTNGHVFSDVALSMGAQNWFLEVEPNQSYVLEIGLLHADGRFIALARSNEVTTPRSGMSDVLDEEWMSVDFEKMYALSGGFEIGKSSAALRRLMEERLRSSVTSGSGGWSSGSLQVKARQFRFSLDCELIVHGATEPDALVTVNGKAVQLRSDGTFTLRYALPDGSLKLEARAFSADGAEERTIVPRVTRVTDRPAPRMLKKNGRSRARARGRH